MTRMTNARVAGVTFLAYIAATIVSIILFEGATAGDDVAARLVAAAGHAPEVRAVALLGLFQAFAALVLAVTLYAITRDQDRELALLAMTCRVVEGVIVALSVSTTLALLWVATATGPDAPDESTARALGGYFLGDEGTLGATFFAVGSTLFAYLLLRGRLVPAPLAWLGVLASGLLVICLPAQLAGLVGPPITSLIWLPALAYEIPLGLWLLVKGVAEPRAHQGVGSGTAGVA